jgi:alpha-mannosidase
MQKHLDITRRRLKNLLRESQLPSKIYTDRAPVRLKVWRAPGRVTYAEAMRGKYRPAKIGENFGPQWATHWFKVAFTIPREWRGREVHFLWDSHSEACIWSKGVPMQGLSGTGVANYEKPPRPVRQHYLLTRKARGGERFSFEVETACNHFGGVGDAFPCMGNLTRAEIAVFDREAWDLLWDYFVVQDMAEHVPRPSTRGAQALWTANEMNNVLNLEDRSTWPAARRLAREFFAARNGDGQHNVSAVGHAHIDTAWLWPLAETRRKCYRTFSTAVANMELYPEYTFVCSQAQQYAWMKQDQPKLYAKIKQRVKEGRFVPVGGMWIEPDCNIPSGESLVRQLLVGQRFFEKEFGLRCDEAWMPDIFGYNGQLPQIMRGGGLRRFVTQKLSWNQTNKPHSHTFWWEGIDGSRVLTHFTPGDNYSSYVDAREMVYVVSTYKDLERSNESLFIYGYGDGGGGPVWESIERLRRMRDTDGLPRVEHRSPRKFFDRLEAGMKPLTKQVGELYLETHRGTLTTQGKTKRLNRRAEEMVHDAEFLSVLAKGKYPVAELDRLWKLVLLNQFHDIIPGSSIREVFDESDAQYGDVLASAGKLREEAVRRIEAASGKKAGAKTGGTLVVNTLGFPRKEVVEVAGRPAIVSAPAMGFSVQVPATKTEQPVTLKTTAGGFVLENAFLRATLRHDGHLTSLVDRRTGRDAIDGRANHFVLFDDVALAFDAWDVEVYHLEKRYEVAGAHACRVVSDHPLRVTLEFSFELSKTSRLKQRVSLDAVSPHLDFACEADWNETEKFLKVEFPTAVRSDTATYEIQFGHVQRSTRFNNSFDIARFEVCGFRWADLSEPGLGLALLNDCKYGHGTQDNVMRLSLLRSPKYPDPQADIGKHHFRYALMPHGGDFRAAGVIPAAQAFNSPLLARKTSAPAGEYSFISCDEPALVIDTVKKAEDSDAIIVRLYEAHGSKGRATLRFGRKFASVHRCNLLEDEGERMALRGNSLAVSYRPFEIITIKLR